jgi:hypothetical protein
MHSDLILTLKLLYYPLGFTSLNPILVPCNLEYGSCYFYLNAQCIQFRVGKLTPTKLGHFVTFYKKPIQGPIQPYSKEDPFNFLVISVSKNREMGQFVFSKKALEYQEIIAHDGIEGKRAFRVYPPWEKLESKQARLTQKKQAEYFLNLSSNKPIDSAQFFKLYQL